MRYTNILVVELSGLKTSKEDQAAGLTGGLADGYIARPISKTELLARVAQRLKGCVREIDTVSRFGGDEFVVLLSNLNTDKAESTAQAARLVEKIRSSLAEPYFLAANSEPEGAGTIEHHCTASIGVVLFIDHEASVDDLIKQVDSATSARVALVAVAS